MANRTQDIEAITTYIESKRALIPQFPKLSDAIKDYEVWLSGLGWYSMAIEGDTALARAKWFRDNVNTVIGEALPPDWVPADAEKAAATTAVKPTAWSTLATSTQLAVIGGSLGVVALLILTGPLYFKTYLGNKVLGGSPKLNFTRIKTALDSQVAGLKTSRTDRPNVISSDRG